MTILLQSATGITKCDDYYKVRQYMVPNNQPVGSGFSSQTSLEIQRFRYDATGPQYLTVENVFRVCIA